MGKASLIIKIILCVMCAILIITVFTMQFMVDMSSSSVRTAKDLEKIIAFTIVSAIMLVIVVALGVVLLIQNKKRNDILLKLVEESERAENS